MNDFTSLRGQFLVSMPSMQGDYFSQTVTLMIEHNQSGAFGLVMNKPLTTDLKTLLCDHKIVCDADVVLLESGPVEQDRLFFIHSSDALFEGSVPVNPQVTLSTSLDLVDAISAGDAPNQILAGLGYAGWSPGQLEREISEDVWLVTPYNHNIMFDTPFEARPLRAAATIGVDLNLISTTPGHG